MNKQRIYAWGSLAFSVLILVALAAWNYSQARSTTLQAHVRWASRIFDQVDREQSSFLNRVASWKVNDAVNLRTLAQSSPDIGALYFTDTEYHRTRTWFASDWPERKRPIDPRSVAVQLESLKTQKVTLGPILLIDQVPHVTVVKPIDEFRALIAVFQAPMITRILREETALWRLHVWVYDSIGTPMFVAGDIESLRPELTRLLASYNDRAPTEWVPLSRSKSWQWTATSHKDPQVQWLIVIAETTLWVVTPFILFLIALAAVGVLWWLPWNQLELVRKVSLQQDLENYSSHLDQFIRGRQPEAYPPPESIDKIAPLVHTLRWLIPQWKKAESFPRELALERKLLSLLIESLPEGILVFNAQGVLQLGNELGKVFLALQQEPGREYKMQNGIQIPRGFLEAYVEPVFTGAQRNNGKESEVAWADGKHLYRIWVEAIQTQDDHSNDGFIIVIRDITFRKQWEYVQEQVLSGITHDLRGPLSAVVGYLDLMRRQLKDDSAPKLIEYIQLAREASQRLSQMVSDILDVVRFEQGKIELQPQQLSVENIFQKIRNTFSVNAAQKNIQILFDQPETKGLVVSGDPKLLERVFDNLVGNAIKFTPTNGHITVTAQRQAGRVYFSVKDTGRGIPKEAQARVFEKFQQVRPGDRSGGYGLGLAVVKFIVEAHKGEIRVESEIGKGSIFTFYIPDLEPVVKSMSDLSMPDPLPPANA